uniref:Autophagy-related protein 11 C-terminal domain-containing protein n=1 Tax=Cyclophora tenuis TaxID=216820 RepID=A0A7S1D9L6_CYCTE
MTVSNIRRHLAAAVPPSDQILLLGPPYKVPKDSTLQSSEVLNSLRLGDEEDDPASQQTILSTTESSGARRLFLFSKQSLSEHAPDPPPCQLSPTTLTLPIEPGPSPLQFGGLEGSTSPLHQALEVYERRFMLNLDQGRVLADGADMRLATCRNCVSEQAVMARALRAAVSNLSVHFNGALRLRSEFTAEFQAKTAAHTHLLQKFESLLAHLGTIPLHPALVSVARAAGRVMETLLDTVPVESERAWAGQCQTAHQRLHAMFSELEAGFGQLGTTSSREEEARQDAQAETEIQALWKEVAEAGQKIRDRQSQRLEKLTTDHGEVVKVVRNAISGDSAQASFAILEQKAKSSADLVPSMQVDDEILKQLMDRLAASKTRAMKRMKVRLREVSKAQSAIQRVNSSVGVLKDALKQQNENMVHLEHVAELPRSYRDFLSEIRRRRAYGEAVSSSSSSMMERLATLRSDEVKSRENFLRGSGRHLMPAFVEIFAPTLATPPPLFTPQLPAVVEMDALPDVGPGEIIGGGSSTDAPMRGEGISSASSLTAATQPTQQEDTKMISENQPPEQLIVSADDQTDHELIVGPSGGTTEDAERKTLAYENAVLRQTLERMGHKSPQAYIDEAKDNDPNLSEIENLRKELAMAKAEAEQAKAALAKRPSDDRISHSSFDVGDLALFMPTGRGSGGKRIYLAFHTNCPHRYLSTDNIPGSPDFILGKIIFQEELVAGELGTDANPYNLHVGTRFWVLTVEVFNSH